MSDVRDFTPLGTPMNVEWKTPAPLPGTHGFGWAMEPGADTPSVVPGYCWCGVWADNCEGLRAEMATVPSMTLDDKTARELSRAAKNVTTWTDKRNALIREALAAGAGVREVARATDLAPATVLNIQTPKKRGKP